MLDPLLLADRLPRLAERAMRDAILGRRARRGLVDEALLRFESLVQRLARDGVRPALLFAERDRIVREMTRFMHSRLAARLFSIKPQEFAATGNDARPFDAIVRGRRGGLYGVALRRLPADGRRLESLRAMRSAAASYGPQRLRGVLVYDLSSGVVRTLSTTRRATQESPLAYAC